MLHVGRKRLSVKPDLALERRGEAGDDAGHRRLAATGFPDDPDRLSAGNVDVDIEQDLHARLAALDASVPRVDAVKRQHRLLPAGLEVRPGCARARRRAHRRHELLGVLVLRLVEDLVGVALLHDLAAVEHDDAVGHLGDDREIVGDVECGGARLLDHVLERGQHLDLGGDVDRGGRLVEHEHVRPARHRHHREQPLELPAAHLVRVLAPDAVRFREPHAPGQIRHLGFRLGLGHRGVDGGAFRDLVAEGVGDVERGRGRLGDVGDAPAAHAALLLEREVEHRGPVEQHLAAGEAASRARVRERRQRDGRLPRPRLPDEGEHLAAAGFERDAADDRHPLAGRTPALHAEIPNLEQGGSFHQLVRDVLLGAGEIPVDQEVDSTGSPRRSKAPAAAPPPPRRRCPSCCPSPSSPSRPRGAAPRGRGTTARSAAGSRTCSEARSRSRAARTHWAAPRSRGSTTGSRRARGPLPRSPGSSCSPRARARYGTPGSPR